MASSDLDLADVDQLLSVNVIKLKKCISKDKNANEMLFCSGNI